MKSTPFSPARTAFFLITTCLCLGWADTWEGIVEKAGTISSVKADFIQEKHLKILSKPLISTGIFYYQSPGSLRWEYQTPIRSVLLMHKGKVERFMKGDQGVVRDSGVKLQAMQVVLQEISLFLSGKFQDHPDFNAALEPDFKISLIPKDPGLTKIIQRIELSLSDQPGVIRRVKIFESEESYTQLIFQNTRMNEKIEDPVFQEM
jgi:outer membrane lipoprotein-sorting protein